HVHFTMSADGVLIGSVTAQDSKYGPGQCVSYSLTFSNATLDPHSQPLKSNISLGIIALVGAGLYSSTTTASDSELVTFSGPPCGHQISKDTTLRLRETEGYPLRHWQPKVETSKSREGACNCQYGTQERLRSSETTGEHYRPTGQETSEEREAQTQRIQPLPE